MSEQKLSEQIKNEWKTGMLRPTKKIKLMFLQLDDWMLQARKLEARLEEPARCNSGHETLPLKLWTCPTCHEKLERKLETLTRASEALIDDVHMAYPEGLEKLYGVRPYIERLEDALAATQSVDAFPKDAGTQAQEQTND